MRASEPSKWLVRLRKPNTGPEIRPLFASIRLRSQFLFVCALLAFTAQAAERKPVASELALRDFITLVLERNESIHLRMLEFEINRKRHKAEWGTFEPEFVASYDRIENERQNTAEQRRSSGVEIFTEKNNIYNGGLEALVPTGARIRLGYTLRDLRNNLQDPIITTPTPGTIVTNAVRGLTGRPEYQTFVGLSATQPLLKNAWNTANFASLRIAALASDIAYQDYRRQMMMILSTAEAAYWNLFLAQEQVRFFEDSVALAEGLVRDFRARLQAGRASDLDVLQAEAGLALRKSKLAEAQQRYRETGAQLRTLISLPADATGFELRATDQPNPGVDIPAFDQAALRALSLNPDYLTEQKKLAQENVRLAYAKNQRLPQLDLKASYGLNGLGDSPGESWEETESANFPSFSVGVELRIPIIGGIRAKNQRDAARLKKEQALLQVKEVETQVLNAIQTALLKVQNARDTVANYRDVVRYDEDLLKTQIARLEVGTVEGRKVLEAEAELFEAKNAVAEALVQHERARLELVLVQGSLLEARNLEWSQKELQERTGEAFRRAGGTEERFNDVLNELKSRYNPPGQPKS
jgi:outer membrane protein TolC